MTDVDTIRRVARDHDLEFVDLDTYGVDPTAGEILPASLARRHKVVAIKRKFGTPVVATSDPDDFNAQDTVRASIGRDFISVVASRDQIITYLDQLFGPDDDGLVFENFSADENSNGVGTDESRALDLLDADGDPAAVGSADAMETIDFAADAMSTLEDELSTLQAESSVQITEAPDSPVPDAPVPEPPSFDSALTASVEELAELARTTQEDQQVPQVREEREDREEPSLDTTTQAADFVAEVVATYEEKQQEEQPADAPEGTTSNDAAMFPPLARALVEGERVSLDDMQGVLDEHDRTGQSVARILTAQGLVTEADLMWGMAQEMGLEFVDLDIVGLDFSEAGTIPEATARHHNVIVIANDNGVPVVAASNPTDVFAMDDLRTIIGRNFIVVVATRSQIAAYIGRAFNSGDASDMAMEASLGFDGSGPDTSVDDIQAVTEEAPIVRYVNLLILQALNERASDIHIEPTEKDLRIRYRIDGVLHDVSTAPRTIAPAVTTRLKVMADMNIAEHRIPQDGRISLNVGSKGIDLRMATLPTIYGEKVVMRVLDKSSVVLGFADLGFEEHLLKTYESIYTKPYGTILVTGPTGSGKSTTLYTTLTALNSPEKNIITVEDPVELPLKGVNQVQLNLKAGLNFASALRAILRSDPDIVLVGEIRDKETAVIAIEAALTGHMVLATLHTNNAASTPMRLIEMGLEPFLVTSSVSGVLAQRLARRLCAHCKQAYEPTESEFVSAGWKLEEVEAMGGISTVYRAAGCSACANTGYRGRKALAELLPMSEEIERTIIEGGSVEEIHRVGVAQGMTTLRQSGLRKALDGETTIEEVLRVVA
ncbi:MAG: Flp pilus assembly complex ATPase component TadA [Acidimicrobiales bacterium]|nr:Flp pilus assembly complex ATPase component TadA [Acidimicrobiales bacterium]